jgi:hypothetical protein
MFSDDTADPGGEDVRGWFACEKLDGCRGYWTGSQMFSRSGRAIRIPREWPRTGACARNPLFAAAARCSAAGVVDTSLLNADLRQNKTKVSLRRGNNDSVRASVDFNRVHVDRKLALRIAALHDREEYRSFGRHFTGKVAEFWPQPPVHLYVSAFTRVH